MVIILGVGFMFLKLRNLSSLKRLNDRAASYDVSSAAVSTQESSAPIKDLCQVFSFFDTTEGGITTVQRVASCLSEVGVSDSRQVAIDFAGEVRKGGPGPASTSSPSSLEKGFNDETTISFEEFLRAGLQAQLRGSGSVHFAVSRIKGHLRKPPGRRVIYCFLVLTFLVLVGASSVLFEFFQCQRFALPDEEGGGEESFIRRDYSISCTSNRYQMFVPFALIMVLVYPVGIPALYAALLLNNREVLSDPSAMEEEEAHDFPRVGHVLFLVEAYSPEFFYFEVIECVRRLLLASIIGIANSDSAASPVIGLLLSLIFIHVFERYLPYKEPSDSVLGVVLAYALALLFLAALLIKVNATSDDTQDQALFGVLLVLILFAGPVLATSEGIYLIAGQMHEFYLRKFKPLRTDDNIEDFDGDTEMKLAAVSAAQVQSSLATAIDIDVGPIAEVRAHEDTYASTAAVQLPLSTPSAPKTGTEAAAEVKMTKMEIRKLQEKIEVTRTGMAPQEAQVSSQVAKHDTPGATPDVKIIDTRNVAESRPGELFSSPSGGQGTTI